MESQSNSIDQYSGGCIEKYLEKMCYQERIYKTCDRGRKSVFKGVVNQDMVSAHKQMCFV